MKIIAIPDIHQTAHWKKVIPLMDSADKVVFLGDEFDEWENKWPGQMDNAKAIIHFAKKDPEKICLCWSNHATSYYLDEQCSGYQRHHAFDIKEFYRENKDCYKAVHCFDNWLFSHAGVSSEWMACAGVKSPEEINLLFLKRPNFFRFVGPDNYGDNRNEGPFWIRPRSLLATSAKGYNQCVGHTESHENPKLVKLREGNKILFIDSKNHDRIVEIDTETNEWRLI